MAESVVISNIKENILEFDAEVKGIKDPKMSVNFVIKTEVVDLSFKAKHERGNTWSVVIPPLKMLEIGNTHKYLITVVVEGYHFEPMTGEVQIVGEIKARVTKPSTRKAEKKADVAVPAEKKEETAAQEPEKTKVQEPVAKEEAEEETKKEDTKESQVLDKTIEKIITRETLRKSPADVAVRKVLGEVKKAAAIPAPTPEVPTETPEQVSMRLAEEAKRQEQLAREEAVRNILKGMSGTRATIRH